MKLATAFLLVAALAAPAIAQLGERNQLGVPMAHVHLLVRDVDAHTRFWTEQLGATVVRNGPLELLELPRVYVMLTQAADHFGFFVKDFPAELARWKAAGIGIERLPTKGRAIDHAGFDVENMDAFGRHLETAGVVLEGPVRTVPGTRVKIAFLTDPWGTRIELTEGLAP